MVIDDYSRFPEIEVVTSTSSQAVLPKLDAIFSRQGVQEIVRTDNGPPFNGEQLSRFASTCGFTLRKIMPLWPTANGEAERFMGILTKAVRRSHFESGSSKQE